MIERERVAHCVVCGWVFSPKALKIALRNENGPVMGFRVYPSGCKCGTFYIQTIDK